MTEQLELLQKELEKIESVTKLLGVGKDIVPLSEEEVCFIWFLSLYVLCFICTDIIVFGICFAIKLLVRC